MTVGRAERPIFFNLHRGRNDGQIQGKKENTR